MIEQTTNQNELPHYSAVECSRVQSTKSRRYKKSIPIQLDPELLKILVKYSAKVKANRNQVVNVAIINFLMLSSEVSHEDKIKLNNLILKEDKRQKYNPNNTGDTEFKDIDDVLERVLKESKQFLESLRFIDFKIVIDSDND